MYITKKVSAYNPTEECWLETLYAHSATASLKVNGVKYKEKNTRSTRSFFGDLYPFNPTSVGITTFVILACCISRMPINE